MSRHGIRADKSLGQHFLNSPEIVARIVGAVPTGAKSVLEIGPGPGVLTVPLCKSFEVTALELDHRWQPVLQEVAPLANVIWGDALAADWAALVASLPGPIAIVSNMPYQITGPLLQKVEDVKFLIAGAVLMMQKEVADKIMAQAGSALRGAVSVNLQGQFIIKRLVAAPAGAFLPPPKVDSMVLTLTPRHDPWPWGAVVKSAFASPRKTLANNLRLSVDQLNACGLSPTIRPHQLTEEQWKILLSNLP